MYFSYYCLLNYSSQVPTIFFTYNHLKLAYRKIGSGSQTLLLFHGYGQDASVFDDVTQSLSDRYTCYCFDLFFHGESIWAYDEAVLTKAFWAEMITGFIREQNIEYFSLAGFSLGGRFVLATVEALPARIEAVYLLAPDGVKTNFWYNLATYPVVFRKLFKSMILHPNRFYSIAHFIHNVGLVDKGLIRFAESQMKTETMRKRVYYSWVVLRKLKFDMERVAQIFTEQRIPVTLVLGKFDKVITLKNMQRLLQHLPDCQVQLLDTGHNGIIGRWKIND
jgi:pimeloyl-ACP methyl ester carboxylesterase